MKDMNSSPCKCSDLPVTKACSEREIIDTALQAGACACAVTPAEEVDREARDLYVQWIDSGMNGTMQYCRNYTEVRDDPRLLLPGCKWLIICAFSYSVGAPSGSAPRISRYALGADYHHVLPAKMQSIADFLTENYGGQTMIAVDTKPLRERYWARKAGLGWIGKNNQLIVPGIGSYVFLATLLWTGDVEPSEREEQTAGDFAPLCRDCDACVKVCPNGALRGDGSCDARRCISYLTIEHKGSIPPDMDLRGWIYGCDLCQMVCPYNNQSGPESNASGGPAVLDEFQPRSELLALDEDALRAHSGRSWKRFLGTSPMQRVPLSRLLSNIARIK